MLSAVLFLAQVQGEINWVPYSKAFAEAEKSQKLVMCFDHVYNPSVESDPDLFFHKSEVVKAVSKFVCSKGIHSMGILDLGPYNVPGCRVRFLDKDDKPRGFAFVPMDPQLFVEWTDAIQSAWKKHDALVFRSKGRLTDQDSARLAFSYAMRGETDQASACLAAIPIGHLVDEAEFGYMALALAYADKGDRGPSIDCWLKLENLTKSPTLKSAARLGCGAAMETDRPREAQIKLKLVLNSKDSSSSDKVWAKFFLERLKARGYDGG